jgi:hypothetical protein
MTYRRGKIVGVRFRRPGVLESQNSGRGLLQPPSRAIRVAYPGEKARDDFGWTLQNPGV